ncbi:COG1188 Ribosome-associated heat shock protein implicated in the recycling of the 50S subunit (S4 paralog) [Rhabdaerophilaceae bacterium]
MARSRLDPDEAGRATAQAQRLDKWIWHARFLRSRTDAAELVRQGRVRLNGMRITQPGHAVKLGAVLTLALPHETIVVRVAGFAERRGSAGDAEPLYALVTANDQSGEAAPASGPKSTLAAKRNPL